MGVRRYFLQGVALVVAGLAAGAAMGEDAARDRIGQAAAMAGELKSQAADADRDAAGQASQDYAEAIAALNRGNSSRAITLLTRAARQGDAGAQLRLGGIYSAEGALRDLKTAFAWYRQAADQGDAAGEYKVGMMLLRGEGVKRDVEGAAMWLKKSAEQGYARAQTNYGSLCLAGMGVDQDFIQAVQWFKKAAEQNYGDAQYLMGVAYEHGEGVARDVGQAKAWYKRAVANGNGLAKGPLYRLEGYPR